VSKAITLFSIA